jgi:hypothetical protein
VEAAGQRIPVREGTRTSVAKPLPVAFSFTMNSPE